MNIVNKYSGTLGLLILLFASAVTADGAAAKYKNSPLNSVYQLIDDKKFNEAIAELSKVDKVDADVLNLLGFSNRKLQNYDTALEYYQQALQLEPEHKGANEYLGQLYVETGKLDKARERLAVLDKACFFSCREYRSLKRSIEASETSSVN